MQVPQSSLSVLLALASIGGVSAQTTTQTGSIGVVGRKVFEPVFVPLLQEGDVVAGVGNVTSISNLAVNTAGDWIVEAATNALSDVNDVLIKNGSLFLREGDSLALPVGATIDTFDAITLNNLGNSGWNFFLDGTTGGSDDSGLYYDDQLLIQEGSDSTAPELSANTPYLGFFESKINDSNQILYIASVDDPVVSGTVEQALLLATVDGSGALTSETAMALEGDLLPGQTETLNTFQTAPHTFSLNAAGDAMFVVDLNGSTAADGAVYLNGSVIAQEGGASPVAGRNWSLLGSTTAVNLNDSGSYVLRGSLNGPTASNSLLVKDGAKFMQEGDSLPAIAPFTFTSFGTGPVWLGNDGSVLWYGEWNDPDTDVNSALFLDDRILVQEGVTTLGGLVVDTVRGIQDGYAISDDGLRIVFEAVLVGNIDTAYMIVREDVPQPVSESAVTLVLDAGPVHAGRPFALAVGAPPSVPWQLSHLGTLDETGRHSWEEPRGMGIALEHRWVILE